MHIVHLDEAHAVSHIDIVQEIEVRVRVHEDKPILEEEVILVDDAVIAVMIAVIVVIAITWQ